MKFQSIAYGIVFSTKGTFTAGQAEKAEQIFKLKYGNLNLDQDYTYCFAVIYPENKRSVLTMRTRGIFS